MTNKKIICFISTCLAVGASAALYCQAADESTAVVGVLTSKTGHTAGTEPVVQRAIEVLIKQHMKAKPPEEKLIQPEQNQIGAHPLRSPSLIIGDADMVPM